MNKIKKIVIYITSISLWAVCMLAYSDTIKVSDSFVRETIPGTHISSAYMTIHNTGKAAVTLLSASSPRFPRIEIHEHIMSDGMMSMIKKDSVTIENGVVVFKPMGLHFMIFDIEAPLRQGDEVILTLHFSDASDVSVKVPVYSIKRKQVKHDVQHSEHQHH